MLPTVMLCEAAPPSLHPVNTYCVPAAPACVVATAIVCVPGVRLSVCGAVCAAPPSTLNCNPGGLVWIVMVVNGEKLAFTVSGALMVTVVEGSLAFATVPLQPLKVYPLLAFAAIGTTAPAP